MMLTVNEFILDVLTGCAMFVVSMIVAYCLFAWFMRAVPPADDDDDDIDLDQVQG